MLAVQRAANDAGFLYRDQTKHDFGIDLHFELTDDRKDATGRLVAVQVKTGDSYFGNPKEEEGWWYYISERHSKYWLNHSLPVILALHDFKSGITYWERVASDSIERTSTGGSKLLVPRANILDDAGFDIIANFAQPSPSISTRAFSDFPGRHLVVMRDAMQAAARDDARIAFTLAHGTRQSVLTTPTLYHMGDPMGRYVLTAYREFDEYLALSIVVEHLTSLNEYLETEKEPPVTLKSLLAGFAMALPSDTHPDELKALKNYIFLHAEQYWGAPL